MADPADENLEGADDPEEAARALLEESDERTEQARERADDGTIEHRQSEDTA